MRERHCSAKDRFDSLSYSIPVRHASMGSAWHMPNKGVKDRAVSQVASILSLTAFFPRRNKKQGVKGARLGG